MQTAWFAIVALMLAVYVVLDGFDLGAGIVHLFVARDDAARRRVLGAIGPVWDGNEVWLLAAGGTLFFAFPTLYASSFSGFYLPLMIVLWLLILRGISIEFRNHLASPLWQPFWDIVFAGSSALLAVFFGAALGNVIRGVPLDSNGEFFLPLWTDFTPGTAPGILDWYTLLVGLAALAALALHGLLWLALRTPEPLAARARRFAGGVWWASLAAVAVLTPASFHIQRRLLEGFSARPWGCLFPLAAIAGLLGARFFNASGRSLQAFLGSSLFLAALLAAAAFGIYPDLLPSNTDPGLSLTIRNAATSAYGARVGLVWFVPGLLLAVAYFAYTYRNLGKAEDEGY